MYQKYIKRFFDIILSLCCIILSSPILLVTALLVRIKLGSPVIFKQERPGYHNEVFTLYKFRSMTDAKDENGNLLPDKERLPRFGQLLRSTSLDELPEFFNILFGHMSFVGPRPLLKQYVDFYSARQKRRADVRPGLTGLAQVNGRNAISWEEKFEFDLEYVDSISLITDIKIMFQTVTKVLKRAGISAQESVTMYAFQGTKKGQFSKYKRDGHIKILFSSVGDQVEFIDTFRYAAGKLGVKVTFVGCDHSLEAPALYRCHKHYQVPEPGEEGYITALLHICKQENIGLIMDVPLEVTVELGRTKKSIAEILDFTPGTIIELDKIAGEPIDVLVNGKCVNVPSYLVKAGDVIEIREKSKSLQRYKDIVEVTEGRLVPEWLDQDIEGLKGTVKSLPTREMIDVPVDEMLIVELYSK